MSIVFFILNFDLLIDRIGKTECQQHSLFILQTCQVKERIEP